MSAFIWRSNNFSRVDSSQKRFSFPGVTKLAGCSNAVTVEWCGEMLHQFQNGDSKSVTEVVTNDEIRVTGRIPKQSASHPLAFSLGYSTDGIKEAMKYRKQCFGNLLLNNSTSANVFLWKPKQGGCTMVYPSFTTSSLRQHCVKTLRPAHCANTALKFLGVIALKMFTRPRLSKDLAPQNFLLFPVMK